jgi:stage II sporulation protein D
LKTKLMLILLFLGSFIFPVYVFGQSMIKEPNIRVGILSNQPNVMISANNDFVVADTDTKKIIAKFKPREKVSITLSSKSIAINGKPIASKGINITSKANSESAIMINRHSYRGEISIHRTYGKNGLTVINTLPIEQYLYGVVAREMSPGWPSEAVKAQAVAARTYALYSLSLKKHKADGYDVCASTDCQVYGGRDSEAAGAVKAVSATYGETIYYKGKLIPAYFHSSSGGYTENSENVWGGAYPYLQGVADYDQKSPYFKWEKKFTVNELEMALKNAGYDVGSIQSIELSRLTQPPVRSFDRGISGRVKEIRVTGTNGTVYITGNKLRSALALKSTLFDIEVILPGKKVLEFDVTDSYGDRWTKEVPVNLPSQKNDTFLNQKNAIHRITARTNETIVFTGFGWGHGIGLSQWGAKAMAENAPKGDTTYFKQILKHYYQGVDIKKAY